jgi:hypothetical protein
MNDAQQHEPATECESAEESRPKPAPLAAEDFYMENGLLVFTAAYHIKRGYCCNSGCRHCPYQ